MKRALRTNGADANAASTSPFTAVTVVALQTVFSHIGAGREVLEAVVSLVAVARAIAEFDLDLTARMETARADRRVWCTELPDGMGFLGLVHELPTVKALFATITADGRTLQLDRGGAAAVRAGDDDARADASRADAMAARMLGTVQEDGSVTWDRAAQQVVSMTLVMDLDTLRGEQDRFALLDGSPIPAGLARDQAEGATLWRRAVTDPVTGVLLDYGTEQYLPEPLRRYIKARDRVCGTPICSRTGRLEMDHAQPYPAGTTSAGNCHAWCKTCHQLKTERRLRFTDTKPDGSATLITAWGQRFSIPPRPFLHDPTDRTDHEPDPPGISHGPAPRPEPDPPGSDDDRPPF